MKRSLVAVSVLLVAFLTLFLVPVCASAASYDEGGVRDDLEHALDDFAQILPPGMEDLADDGAAIDRLGFEAILGEAVAAFNGSLGAVGSFFLLLIGASVLMAAVNFIEGELSGACRIGVVTVCSVAIFSGFYPLVGQVSSAMSRIGSFFSSVCPVMLGVAALGSGANTVGVHSAAMTLTLQFYSAFSEGLIWLVCAIFALGLASSAGNDGLSSVARGIRSAFTRGMGILTALLAGTLSLQTLVASSADSAVIRAAKYSASGLIPVVGNAVSGALSTLAGGLAYTKGIIGGGAVAVIVSLSIAPLITLLLYKLCFFVATTFLEFCSADYGARSLSAMSCGLDALISVYSMSTVIYILQVILFVMGGAGF